MSTSPPSRLLGVRRWITLEPGSGPTALYLSGAKAGEETLVDDSVQVRRRSWYRQQRFLGVDMPRLLKRYKMFLVVDLVAAWPFKRPWTIFIAPTARVDVLDVSHALYSNSR